MKRLPSELERKVPRQLQKCSESARYGIRARNKSNQNCNRKCGGNNKSAVKDQGMASEMDRIVPRRQQKYTECVRIPSSELELKVWGQLQNYSESVKYFLIGQITFCHFLGCQPATLQFRRSAPPSQPIQDSYVRNGLLQCLAENM